MLCDFLKVDLLGTLFLDEVFFFYEEPQVFNCENKTGQKYLALLTDMNEREWILCPISEARLSLLKVNRLSIKDAIINPEDDFVWKIKDNPESFATAKQLHPSDIGADDLPGDDVFIDYKYDV